MRTRKPFIHEDGIYDGVSRIPEPREIRSKSIITMNDSYDWYPEKDSTKTTEAVISRNDSYDWYPEKDASIKTEPRKFEELVDSPLGDEYRLKSQIEHYSISNTREAYVLP